MLQNTISTRPIDAASGQIEDVNVALPNFHLGKVRRARGGLSDDRRILVETDDRPSGANRFSQRWKISTGTAPEVQHHIVAADPKFAGCQALVRPTKIRGCQP
jgi:hypothetical protein